ncbi:unnamed protein product, partial [Sphacelaria rigidula]
LSDPLVLKHKVRGRGVREGEAQRVRHSACPVSSALGGQVWEHGPKELAHGPDPYTSSNYLQVAHELSYVRLYQLKVYIPFIVRLTPFSPPPLGNDGREGAINPSYRPVHVTSHCNIRHRSSSPLIRAPLQNRFWK